MENEFQVKTKQLNKVLSEYKTKLDNDGYIVLGVFLYGSQNYNMDTPDSDVDAYAVVLPGKYNFTFSRYVNKTVKFPKGEVKVKDLRVFVSELLKGNYSTLETLLTPYRVLSPCLVNNKPVFAKLLDTELTDRILTYDLSRTVRSALGSAENMKQYLYVRYAKLRLKNMARIKHLHHFCGLLMDYTGKPDFIVPGQTKPLYRLALSGAKYYGDADENGHLIVEPEVEQARDLKLKDPEQVSDTEINKLINRKISNKKESEE